MVLGGGHQKGTQRMADATEVLGEAVVPLSTVRGVTSGFVIFQFQEDTMSLSSAFRAVGNDPGIITWRIEVSQMGIHTHPDDWDSSLWPLRASIKGRFSQPCAQGRSPNRTKLVLHPAICLVSLHFQ